jgi:hypothetical protein
MINEGLNLPKKKYIEQIRKGLKNGGYAKWFWSAPWNEGGLLVRQEFYDVDNNMYLWRNYIYNTEGKEISSYDSNGAVTGWEIYHKNRGRMGMIDEGLNLPKKIPINHDIVLEQFNHFMNIIGENQIAIDDFTDGHIMITINNVGNFVANYIDVSIHWYPLYPYEIHIYFEKFMPDVGDGEYGVFYTDVISINNPNLISDDLNDFFDHIINGTTILHEGLNLVKKRDSNKFPEKLEIGDKVALHTGLGRHNKYGILVTKGDTGVIVDVKEKRGNQINKVTPGLIDNYYTIALDYVPFSGEILIFDNLTRDYFDLISRKINEGLNLPKKKIFDKVELTNGIDINQTRYAKVGYRVGWNSNGKFETGTVKEIYSSTQSGIVIVIEPDNYRTHDSLIEVPLNLVIGGVL